MHLEEDHFGEIMGGSMNFMNLYIKMSPHIWEILSHYLFK